VLFGKNIFGLIIANSISKGSPFQVWHVFNFFLLWMHCKLNVHFSHIFELLHGLKVYCACPCKALDGWAFSSATLKSRQTS